MKNMKLAQCPAVRQFVELEECRRCDNHVDGVGCPNLNRVVPRAFCLVDCPHGEGDDCKAPKVMVKHGKPILKAEAWDSEAPMCNLPRMIQVSSYRPGPLASEV